MILFTSILYLFLNVLSAPEFVLCRSVVTVTSLPNPHFSKTFVSFSRKKNDKIHPSYSALIIRGGDFSSEGTEKINITPDKHVPSSEDISNTTQQELPFLYSTQEQVSTPTIQTQSQPSTDKLAEINPKISNALERTGPAILMLVMLYMLVRFLGERGINGLILITQVSMYNEATNVVESYYLKESTENSSCFGNLIQMTDKWLWFATILACVTFLPGLEGSTSSGGLICSGMIALSLVSAVLSMASTKDGGPEFFRKYLGKMAMSYFASIFLLGQSLFWKKTMKDFGMEWILYPALLVIVNDTMAYVFGVLMGKNKLLPHLSPKKTVEGFLGAALSTIAVSIPLLKFVLGYNSASLGDEGRKALSCFGDKGANGGLAKHALAIALYVSFISPFGGFLASAVKRAHGAKDFGALIPGHGGVIDRLDCQLVTAPFVFLYLSYISSMSASSSA
mmetsp:Transcript_17763/g.25081  ORF Transcript_17763/g.25081 Transcript_17763/m.25081 type:complete len:451 (+) Transcript_17763:156-1508(+)